MGDIWQSKVLQALVEVITLCDYGQSNPAANDAQDETTASEALA